MSLWILQSLLSPAVFAESFSSAGLLHFRKPPEERRHQTQDARQSQRQMQLNAVTEAISILQDEALRATTKIDKAAAILFQHTSTKTFFTASGHQKKTEPTAKHTRERYGAHELRQVEYQVKKLKLVELDYY